MTQLLFSTYQVDNDNSSPFDGEFVDWQLGTSDGTAGNGTLLKQINNTTLGSGDPNFNNADPYYFTQLGANVLFMANDGIHGDELWITDGTGGGTQLVKDINPGSASGLTPNTNPSSQASIAAGAPVVVGTEMYFQANDGNGINELWKSDGTTSGTVLVKSFNADTMISEPSYMVNFDGVLYFVANGQAGFVEGTSAGGPQIWKSNGTASGTVQVTNIAPSATPDPADGPAGPFSLTVSGTNLFFDWYNGNDNDLTDKEQQLYVINHANPGGLELTTQAVGGVQNLTNADGELYFTMNDGTHGTELWKSDGTVNGTQLVDDIYTGGSGNNANSSAPTDLTYWNGDIYFFAYDGQSEQLWKSDGATTTEVTSISHLAGGLENYGQLTAVGNTLYFVANDRVDLTQLWEYDGIHTPSMVTSFDNGGNGFPADELTNVNGTLYMGVAVPGANGNQLWTSDGTSAGTVEVTSLYNNRNGFSQISFIATPPAPIAVSVQTTSGIDLRFATLYDELANSPVQAGGTSTQFIMLDTGSFNGDTASIKFVITGTGFTYSGTTLTGGTITEIQVETSSGTVLATLTGLSLSAKDFNAALAAYIAGGTGSPDPTGLNGIFLQLAYATAEGTGANRFQGGLLNDTFTGGAGNDTVNGGAGTNGIDYSGLTTTGLVAIVAGGNGTVNKGGANGIDTLTGVQNITDNGTRSSGDVFEVDSAETVTANSASFNYLIELSTNVTLAYGLNFTGISEYVGNTGTNVVSFATDTHVAYVYGSSGNDTLTLGSGGGYLFGEGGTNLLSGGASATNLFVGGDGGTDTMNGGAGTANNFYYVDGNDTVNGAGAFNTVIELVSAVTVQLGSTQYQDVQEFVADNGANVVTVANTDSAFVYLYGGAGNDTLSTGSGGGYMFGEGGTNTLTGGGGVNVFVADGASGIDTMNGGSGSNIYYIDNNSTVNGAGTFNTVIELQQGVSLTLGSAQLTDVQEAVLAGGTNTVDFHTATHSVFLYAGAGTNTLTGGTGNDFLYGSHGTTTFAFQQGWGKDTIINWANGTSNQIDLTAQASLGVHAITDLTQTIVNGSDVITSSHTGTNSITLSGVGSTLSASSFKFA